MKIQLFVELKIPDTTAITAFHTLEKLGFKLKHLGRQDYYIMDVSMEDFDKFSEEIGKVDILVNVNKHNFKIMKEDEKFDDKLTRVIVKDTEQGDSLLNTLKNRLGLKEINSIEKGVLWLMDCDKETAEKITKELLYNEHYQEFKII